MMLKMHSKFSTDRGIYERLEEIKMYNNKSDNPKLNVINVTQQGETVDRLCNWDEYSFKDLRHSLKRYRFQSTLSLSQPTIQVYISHVFLHKQENHYKPYFGQFIVKDASFPDFQR